MAMVVKNNMSAVRTLNTLNSNTSALQKSLQKVSSGMKINSAQDDASGYAISERMRVRIRSLDQANQNTQNDASLMKTAEGAVGNTVEILRALKEKAINAANDSNTDEDRQTIQKEINQFIDQIDDNALVQFNGKYLIDGSKNNATVSSKTILLNQSLKAGTSEKAALTDLANRAGDSLGIQTSDKWQVSWVENGNINFASGNVGDSTIAEILENAWTDKSGKVWGQVAATTDEGLISSAKPTPEYESVGAIGDGSDSLSDEAKAAMKAAIEELGGTVPPGSDGDTATYSLSELGFYADAKGKEFSSDAKVTIKNENNSTTYTVEGHGSATDLYALKETNTTDKALTTSLSLSTISATITDGKSDDFENDTLGAELIASGNLDITDPDSFSGTSHTETATMKLSDIKSADDSSVAKYYLSADGKETSDVTVTRTKTYSYNSGAVVIDSDEITFTDSDGAPVTGNLFVYNPDYEDPTVDKGNVGFTDAWDKFGKEVYTPDKTSGIAVAATNEGVNEQISGLTISILDQDGNVKKAANAALDQFKQYQRAENKTGDMSLNFHIGSEANVAIKVGMSDMRSEALGLKGSDGVRLDVYTKEHANAAINVIENALTKALDQQTTIGAIEARLEYTSTNLTTSSENVQAAESTIRDADMAKEMTNYTKSNVLLQAAQAMLAQANQNSSAVLSLLQ